MGELVTNEESGLATTARAFDTPVIGETSGDENRNHAPEAQGHSGAKIILDGQPESKLDS
ncbi:hypothetical protein Tcan_05509 [Toxocara canis]|uniref:Uncharacterized protein n=1 Tax=Toxocara canis TaxID=6265 RepID=A0A0B2VSY9_TOXCA|nr:hypothetical protein Tcan_05509 [Toxocara canis]